VKKPVPVFVLRTAGFVLPVLPVLWSAKQGLFHELGANPIQEITQRSGWWCLFLLGATLTVTPARRLLGRPELLKLRRPWGLWSFSYGSLHLATYLWLDKFFDWPDIWKDIVKRPFITAGAASFAAMLPLAATSTDAMVRKLGRNWARLHLLAYAAAAFGILHFWWLMLRDPTEPAVFFVIFTILLFLRIRKLPINSNKI